MVKLTARDAKRFLSKPDPACGAVLIYGPEPTRVAECCRRTVDAIVGEDGRKEMRADRADSGTVSSDIGTLSSMLKSAGFFPGNRTVQLEGASDGSTKAIAYALEQQGADDAFLVVTAGSLRPASSLRKLFEGHKRARCAPVYEDAMTAGDVRELLGKAGIQTFDAAAVEDLTAIGRECTPLELAQVIEKLALYKRNDPSPMNSGDVMACAPLTGEVLIDSLLGLVADKRPAEVGPAFRQVSGRGQNPVTICIMATRMFRRIHQVASDPGGVQAGVGRLRPPVLGPRRDRMISHARKWGIRGSEAAIRELLATDRMLRSGQKVPARAFMEHALIRVAMMRQAR